MTKPDSFTSGKAIIIIELIIATALVIAYNIYDALPFSETPFIFLLVLICFAVHKTSWSSLGFKKPKSWVKVISLGLITAIALQLLSSYVTEPLIARLTGETPDIAQFNVLKGNNEYLIKYMILVWLLAAFGEEIAYRGFIANKFSDLFGSTNKALWAGVIFSSILFGIGHYYQGIAGVIGSAFSGLVFGSVYILSGRNLWVSIFAHGLSDTYGVLYFYFGFYA